MVYAFDIIIFSLRPILDTQACVDDDQWQCGSGECINVDLLCDYSSDCVDGSGRLLLTYRVRKKYWPPL